MGVHMPSLASVRAIVRASVCVLSYASVHVAVCVQACVCVRRDTGFSAHQLRSHYRLSSQSAVTHVTPYNAHLAYTSRTPYNVQTAIALPGAPKSPRPPHHDSGTPTYSFLALRSIHFLHRHCSAVERLAGSHAALSRAVGCNSRPQSSATHRSSRSEPRRRRCSGGEWSRFDARTA
jgi:hypothetical protein